VLAEFSTGEKDRLWDFGPVQVSVGNGVTGEDEYNDLMEESDGGMGEEEEWEESLDGGGIDDEGGNFRGVMVSRLWRAFSRYLHTKSKKQALSEEQVMMHQGVRVNHGGGGDDDCYDNYEG